MKIVLSSSVHSILQSKTGVLCPVVTLPFNHTLTILLVAEYKDLLLSIFNVSNCIKLSEESLSLSSWILSKASFHLPMLLFFKNMALFNYVWVQSALVKGEDLVKSSLHLLT